MSWHSQVTCPFCSDAFGDTAIMVGALRDCLQTFLDAASADAFKLYNAACVPDPLQGLQLCFMLRQRMSWWVKQRLVVCAVQHSLPLGDNVQQEHGCIHVIARQGEEGRDKQT